MVYVHTPSQHHVWIWIALGFYGLDRLVRAALMVYNNLSIFHPRRRQSPSKSSGFWTCKAEFTPLTAGITRLSVRAPPMHWQPGQHVFLSCHSLLPLQSHPFTVSSIPQDGRMEFLVRTKGGGTKRFFHHAEKGQVLPVVEVDPGRTTGTTVIVDGPYGRIRPLRQFDSVVFFAGGIGATFTVPLMRDLVSRWLAPGKSPEQVSLLSRFLGAGPGVVTRHVRFIWVVRSSEQLSWFSSQLSQVLQDVGTLQGQGRAVELEMSIYVTCDEAFTSETGQSGPSSQRCPPRQISSSQAPSDLDEKQASPIHVEEGIMKTAEDKSEDIGSKAITKEKIVKGSCGPDGSCCCRMTITEEEEQERNDISPCTCNLPTSDPSLDPSHLISSSSSSSSISSTEKKLPTAITTTTSSLQSSSIPGMTLQTGRPSPRHLLRPTIEQALGETAVVVCGPAGLATTVRNAAVALSDERAVHKGTGAQGIWLHCEAFGY